MVGTVKPGARTWCPRCKKAFLGFVEIEIDTSFATEQEKADELDEVDEMLGRMSGARAHRRGSVRPEEQPRGILTVSDPITYRLEDAEAMATILDAHPNYRILRRFIPDPARYINRHAEDDEALKLGVFLDVEATGLNTRTDKIIQLSMVPFQYNAQSEIVDAGAGLDYYEDPGMPIPPEIVELTGIDDEMVEGQRIDDGAVRELVRSAGIVIAHHAGYDRPMVERRLPFFADLFWGCSWKDINWADRFGCRSSRLEIILSDTLRQFHEAHRSLDDCHAAVNALANARADDDRPALAHLLESARKNTARVWALHSPIEYKDRLKTRGYTWSPGEHGMPKSWYRDVLPSEAPAEMEWLAEKARTYRPQVKMFTAKDRYSIRVETLPPQRPPEDDNTAPYP